MVGWLVGWLVGGRSRVLKATATASICRGGSGKSSKRTVISCACAVRPSGAPDAGIPRFLLAIFIAWTVYSCWD
ncbi:hypothetical protein M0804_011343 [Polistes exclamans]|nr:hypothetical protein M0804_011343 [Polistes exclamans]